MHQITSCNVKEVELIERYHTILLLLAKKLQKNHCTLPAPAPNDSSGSIQQLKRHMFPSGEETKTEPKDRANIYFSIRLCEVEAISCPQ